MSKMEYKGYTARIEYDNEDEIFFGRILGIRDIVGFHADTVADLKREFEEAVDHYIESCQQLGKEPQKPASGKIMLRVSPQVHRDALIAAQAAGKSLNQWAEEVLGAAVA